MQKIREEEERREAERREAEEEARRLRVLEEEAANLQRLMDETGAPAWPPDPASDGPSKVLPR